VGRIDRVADAAFHFRAQHQRVHEIRTGDRAILREREDGRCDWPGRVNDGAQVRVIEIENMRTDAVHERGMHDVHALAAPQDGSLRGAREWGERTDGDIHGRMARAADGAPCPVE
jgi:hypothetical protein